MVLALQLRLLACPNKKPPATALTAPGCDRTWGFDMAQATDPSVVRRFMSKVALPDDPDDCWLWTAGRRRDDYGLFWIERRVPAHRVAYMLFVGPIPDGLSIDHMCFTPLCVNPRHLRAVTVKRNMENRSGPTRKSKSGIRGVRRSKRGSRWEVDVRHYGLNYYGGSFTDLHEAELAAIALRNQLFTHNDVDRRISA